MPRFIVLVPCSGGGVSVVVVGPYQSFRRAEGDARAWGGSVEPVVAPSDFPYTSTAPGEALYERWRAAMCAKGHGPDAWAQLTEEEWDAWGYIAKEQEYGR